MSDKPPKGGWLGPPGNTKGLEPIAVGDGVRKGQWKWRNNKLTPKQEKRHNKFRRAMKAADQRKEWGFTWK